MSPGKGWQFSLIKERDDNIKQGMTDRDLTMQWPIQLQHYASCRVLHGSTVDIKHDLQ